MTNIKRVMLAFGAVALLMLGGETVGEHGVLQGNIQAIMENGSEQKHLPGEETSAGEPQATQTPTFEADTVKEMNCVMYAKNDVNIRKEPSTSGTLLGALYQGEDILVTGKCRDVSWYRVEYNGAVAYIHANYLTEVSPTGTALVQYANSFWAEEDGTVYVLDSYGRKLVKLKEESVTEILLPGCLLPVDVLLHNREFYVYDEILNAIRIYTTEGIFLEAIEVPVQGDDYVRGFAAEDGVALLTYRGKRLVFHENTATFSTGTYREKTVYSKGYDFTEYVTTDAAGIRYSVNTKLLKDTSILAGELTICASSADGEWIGGFVIPTLKCDWLPDHYVRVTKNGDVYVLMIQEEEFVVKKVELTRNPVSYMEEIRKEAAKIEAAYEKESTRRIKNGATYRKAITLSRETVLERAVAMAEYEWTLTQNNTDMAVARRAQLPHYIATLAEEYEGQTEWQVTMKGIPYCWGGFVSPYAASYERFPKVIDKYLAGNIRSEGEYLAKTAGLDCSGYASALYGISWKLNTRQLSDVGTKRTELTELEKMDMLVAPGDHVVLFVEWLDERTMLATESAIRDGRVTIHPRTLNSFLLENSFQMRTPW